MERIRCHLWLISGLLYPGLWVSRVTLPRLSAKCLSYGCVVTLIAAAPTACFLVGAFWQGLEQWPFSKGVIRKMIA